MYCIIGEHTSIMLIGVFPLQPSIEHQLVVYRRGIYQRALLKGCVPEALLKGCVPEGTAEGMCTKGTAEGMCTRGHC